MKNLEETAQEIADRLARENWRQHPSHFVRRLASDAALAMAEAMLPPATLAQLRELRLHHWRVAMACRQQVECHDPECRKCSHFEAAVGAHLAFVQTLNDFFPLGDTAEADDNRERLARTH